MSADDDRADIYALAYDEGIRVLEGQARTLEQTRLRIAAVLTIATTSSAFAGGIVAKAAADDQDAVYWIGVALAVGLHLAIVWWTVRALQPRYTWHFNLSPKMIVEGYADHETPASLAETHRHLALILDENIDHNQAHLDRMHRRLGWVLGCLVAELACWAWLVMKVA